MSGRGDDAAFAAYVKARQVEVDAALHRVLPAPPDCPAIVFDAMRYSLTAGGKRLRPLLCLAGAEAVGGDRSAAMPAACALELIHTYSLIHDDLPAMDDDTMRRGRPTLHVVAGEAMAILAGDGLQAEAFALLAREPAGTEPGLVARKLRTIAVIAAAAGSTGMVGGQALDLAVTPRREGPLAAPVDADSLRTMHAKKTGALIRAAAAAGAIMGGGSDAAIDAIDSWAAELGLAFQIVDDVLDVEGASAALGKTAGKDAASGKPTYPSLFGLEASKRMARECIDRAEATLSAAGLDDRRLVEIARWIVQRSH